MTSNANDRTLELHRHVTQLLGRNANGILWSSLLQWVLFIFAGYELVSLDGSQRSDLVRFELVAFWFAVLLLSGIAIHVFQASCQACVRAATRISETLATRLCRDSAWPAVGTIPSHVPSTIAWVSCTVLLFIQVLVPTGVLLFRITSPESGVPILALVALTLLLFSYVVRRTMTVNANSWSVEWTTREVFPESA